MEASKAFYTPHNCRPAYQLNWSLTVYWNRSAPGDLTFVPALIQKLEPSGIRLLEHRLEKDTVSQFWLSTKPHVVPIDIVRQVKGRLQYIVRSTHPKAFRRHYYLSSVGSARREIIEGYIGAQRTRHRMADERVQRELMQYDFVDLSADLSKPRIMKHGRFLYNLHIVLVYLGRRVVLSHDILGHMYRGIISLAGQNRHVLGRMSVIPDHTHFALGCHMHESPESVVLHYMNGLAAGLGQDFFQSGYYVGTFGEYDVGAMRSRLRFESPF